MQNADSIKVKFKKLWPFYIIQSTLASISLAVLLLLISNEYKVALSAMSATAFIVYAMPRSVSAQTRNVLGGHIVGLLCGMIFLPLSLGIHIEYPLVIGLAIFLMVALDFEHPPAAGTALAVVMYNMDFATCLILLGAAIIFALSHHLLGNHLRDLV